MLHNDSSPVELNKFLKEVDKDLSNKPKTGSESGQRVIQELNDFLFELSKLRNHEHYQKALMLFLQFLQANHEEKSQKARTNENNRSAKLLKGDFGLFLRENLQQPALSSTFNTLYSNIENLERTNAHLSREQQKILRTYNISALMPKAKSVKVLTEDVKTTPSTIKTISPSKEKQAVKSVTEAPTLSPVTAKKVKPVQVTRTVVTEPTPIASPVEMSVSSRETTKAATALTTSRAQKISAPSKKVVENVDGEEVIPALNTTFKPALQSQKSKHVNQLKKSAMEISEAIAEMSQQEPTTPVVKPASKVGELKERFDHGDLQNHYYNKPNQVQKPKVTKRSDHLSAVVEEKQDSVDNLRQRFEKGGDLENHFYGNLNSEVSDDANAKLKQVQNDKLVAEQLAAEFEKDDANHRAARNEQVDNDFIYSVLVHVNDYLDLNEMTKHKLSSADLLYRDLLVESLIIGAAAFISLNNHHQRQHTSYSFTYVSMMFVSEGLTVAMEHVEFKKLNVSSQYQLFSESNHPSADDFLPRTKFTK